MLQYSRQSLLIALCTVFMLDMAFLLGGPILVDFPESNPDWLFSEFELEENEDVGEEETLIQDAEFSTEISLTNSRIQNAEFSVKESDRFERCDSRGPPIAC